MKLPVFDRWDFLATQVVVLGVAALTALVTVVRPLVAWIGGGALEWDLTTDDVGRAPEGLLARDGSTVRGVEGIHVEVSDASAATWAASLLPGVVVSVAALVVALLAVRVLRGIQSGHPFTQANVDALRAISMATALGVVLHVLTTSLADHRVRAAALVDRDEVTLFWGEVPLTLLGALLVVGALAHAFDRGRRLEQDVEGLV
ncbi:DUF2975 domain-containing protein [Nocardioides dongxiaopingii]|uniref:DUF2975 domain-containing protein n=1 Tax=Nocardioides TaxID=1839 RepID=UPI0011627739|nr:MULTISPECIES: DUF2975 domain-containing protein [Nocardioides]QCW51299.2 DUF2975 domain-containing protein [Nocardioides sp. S-1144]